MKINPNATDALRAARPQSETKVRPGAEQTSSVSHDADSIHLSAASLETRASDAPFNAKQVEEIKQAIREGKFTVNAQAVADRFLQIERDLGPLR